MELNDLIEKLKEYNPEEIEIVKKAYYYAEELHHGQKRQSGEDYIIHPLNVAYILADMHADRDTICAGLLHDTLEDTNITKEAIAHDFNENIASLVDGVTKISKLNFSSKQDQNYANTRKIITSITKDVRIIIIKLADRLHNMRTLEYKSEYKQKENSIETMELYVPLAYYIGAYRIKSELEDLSFKYLKPNTYYTLTEEKAKIEEESEPILEEMNDNIKKSLDNKNIENEIEYRTKNIYGIYKRLIEGQSLLRIHDLLSLKVLVNSIDCCYTTLGQIHFLYKPINDKFKDYICNPKTNMYQSLHTTVFGPENKLVQTQIRTFDMDKVASFGLTAYWDREKGNARDVMQDVLKNKFQFYKSLEEIDDMFIDNQEFVNCVQNNLLGEKIYVYTPEGKIIELPIGSTIIDYIYKIDPYLGNIIIGAYVNDEFVPVDRVLNNKDRIKVVTDNYSFSPRQELYDKAHTSLTRKKINIFKENNY